MIGCLWGFQTKQEAGESGYENTPDIGSQDGATAVAEGESGEMEGSFSSPPMPHSGFGEKGSPEGSLWRQEVDRSGPLETVKRSVSENPKVALVAIVGAAGATFSVSRGSGGLGGGR